jgi:hypothetical protein
VSTMLEDGRREKWERGKMKEEIEQAERCLNNHG